VRWKRARGGDDEEEEAESGEGADDGEEDEGGAGGGGGGVYLSTRAWASGWRARSPMMTEQPLSRRSWAKARLMPGWRGGRVSGMLCMGGLEEV